MSARWAAAYAKHLGWRVFPCLPGDKKPAIKDWPNLATDAPETIAAWWRQTPTANIATATGPRSGILVLDVDGPEGERALVELERRHCPLPDHYPMQWTGGGGWQGFFAYPDGRSIRNSTGKLGPEIDTRGEGGYVVLPPSIHPSGNRYRWAADRMPGEGLPGLPAAWLDLLDPPPPPAPARPNVSEIRLPGNRYALKALEDELSAVSDARPGERNDQLNRSAHALLRFVASGELPKGAIVDGLTAAAAHAGLPALEIQKTIRSAAAARRVSI